MRRVRHPLCVKRLALAVLVTAVGTGCAAAATVAAASVATAAPRALNAGAPAPGPLPGAVSCGRFSRARVVFSSVQVVVYRAVVPGYRGERDWACARSGGHALGLGLDALGTAFPSQLTVTEFAAAGSWLAVVASSRGGWNPCGSPRGNGCTTYHHEVELVRAATSSSVGSSSGAHVAALRIDSTQGMAGRGTAAVVWAQRTHGSQVALDSIVARGRHEALESSGGTVAVGAIDPRSIRLHGTRVSFTERGRRRTVTLPPIVVGSHARRDRRAAAR